MENISETMVQMFGESGEYQCKQHGEYKGWERNNACPKCTAEKSRMEDIEKEKQRRAEILAARWSHCGMPEKFCGATLDDWKVETDAQKKTKKYAESFVSGAITRMLLIGNCGTGKTLLAAGIIGAMTLKPSGKIENGKYPKCSPVYMTATRLIRSIRDTWKTKEITEQEAMDKFIYADVLVVDELGAGRCTEDDRQIMSEILCDRYSANKPTLLISNLTGEDIKKTVLDERAVDRIREGGKVVRMNWKSMRCIEE